MNKIFFVVCDNGLGHLVRIMNFIFEIKKQIKCNYYIACTKKQLLKYISINKKVNYKNITFYHHLFKSTPNLGNLNNAKIFDWYKKIKNNKNFINADIVVSDNLPQILNLRNDTILSGSFLWSLVKKRKLNVQYRKFCEDEKKILKKFKPKMFVIKKIFMSELSNIVQPKLINWVLQKNKKLKIKKKSKTLNIGFFVGNTGYDEKIIIALVRKILNTNLNCKIFLPKNIFKKIKKNNTVKLFNFTKYDYSILSVAICRPGLGTVQDLISYKIPFFIYCENDNLELKNNSQKLVKSGLAKKIKLNNVDSIIKLITNKSVLKKLKLKYSKEKTNGAKEFAIHIAKLLKKKI